MLKIAKFGFEIEGEFSERLKEWLKQQGEMKSDGSLRTCPSANHKGTIPLYLGEYNSKVNDIADLAAIKKFFNQLDTFHKLDEFHFNQSCGFHIHLSFNDFPNIVFSRKFLTTMLKALNTKQKTVMELRKGNTYCQTTISKSDVKRGGNERYRFVNLWPAFYRHGTIEFRIFPANNPKTMYRYIVFTLGEVKKFLEKSIKVKGKAKIVIPTYLFTKNFDHTIRPTKQPEQFTATASRSFINTTI